LQAAVEANVIEAPLAWDSAALKSGANKKTSVMTIFI
jgi:hypothetical protein